MFGKLSMSWEFAKTSYLILWQNKRFLLFPVFSLIAAILVSASFILPLLATGTLDTWISSFDADNVQNGHNVWMYITTFLFYFCNYFVIVFFNTALIACALDVLNGGAGSLGYGLGLACKRLPQIFGWSLLSAVIGMILNAIENSNEKVGAIISAILGTAWTALTFFVIPVIVLEGSGPIKALKDSAVTLKNTWGRALIGKFSLGLISFIISLPVFLLLILLFITASGKGSTVGMALTGALFILAMIILAAASSAANMIFKALLYAYASGRRVPTEVDTSKFSIAFQAKQ